MEVFLSKSVYMLSVKEAINQKQGWEHSELSTSAVAVCNYLPPKDSDDLIIVFSTQLMSNYYVQKIV